MLTNVRWHGLFMICEGCRDGIPLERRFDSHLDPLEDGLVAAAHQPGWLLLLGFLLLLCNCDIANVQSLPCTSANASGSAVSRRAR